MGNTGEGDWSEAILGGFLAFMSVMAISTPILFGFSLTTTIGLIAGAAGLSGIIYNASPWKNDLSRT